MVMCVGENSTFFRKKNKLNLAKKLIKAGQYIYIVVKSKNTFSKSSRVGKQNISPIGVIGSAEFSVNLAKWDILCRPKDQGGLGISNLQLQNK
jgi:hypothetical protein